MKRILELKNNQAGFTLLEIIISILLLAITLAGGMALYFNANKIMALMVHKKVAMEMVDKKMEEIRDTSYVALEVGEKEDSNLKISGLSAIRKVSISQPTSEYKQVEIVVNWKEAGDAYDHGVKLVSYVSP